MKKCFIGGLVPIVACVSHAADLYTKNLYDILKKDKAFAAKFKAAVIRVAGQDEYETLMSGPQSSERIMVNNKNYYFYFACESHNCGAHKAEFAVDPQTKEVVGMIVNEDTHKVYTIGQMSIAMSESIKDKLQ